MKSIHTNNKTRSSYDDKVKRKIPQLLHLAIKLTRKAQSSVLQLLYIVQLLIHEINKTKFLGMIHNKLNFMMSKILNWFLSSNDIGVVIFYIIIP